MMSRGKQPVGSGRPEPPWIPAAMIGLSINTLAAGVIAASIGLAIGQAIARGS